ncbi:MAG TPA: ABC transporter ATP-binding protein [Zoogloea sp.]|uniref:ABC transporter ATP-binding protein n=1 Tax=Zoogloea sp. TaxID=49181 RepID=UPI002CB08318|nr:ABC transporter ATP-binding protein [Zoogloea sp.]HMV17355.1 ABC transporter ATP-binding protein [Rhodocyclaceae bacterium]HMW51863.1 ABC transporter ATP-binding protein [Rhodocyclaceae bacterium]HMY49426.1 ABC transporter ATP-binding protein [Rhodocyclaceae bacterium]HMZ76996.1 ABC transporter ATP-binding protein [Rhodocyclaceae bacterium]HNA67928.1 ABC transporter ATP-binding protein [Rhodocyclaceae bacterium]
MITLLEARGITKRFGGLTALSDVSLTIRKGEVYGLIGPNGAGKTTFFNVLTGAYTAEEGELVFNGTELPAGKPHRVVEAGIARTFQNIRLFRDMTALENVMAGHHIRSRANPFAILLQTRQAREEERLITERAYELLRYVGIERFADTVSKNLSYGDQRRLEIARALATEPQLLALDEPAAGMNATETGRLRDLVQTIRHDGITVLLIEHDVKLVMGLCDRLAVLDFGRKIAEDVPAEVQRNEAVIAAYLGGHSTAAAVKEAS